MGWGLGMFGLCVGTISDDFDVGTLVGITPKKMSSAAGLRPAKWEVIVRACQTRSRTCAHGSRGVGMLGKDAVHACVMLATLTYRQVRSGSPPPRVGSR